MIMWYQNVYMDENASKNPQKCMNRVEAVKLWKKSYTLITLPTNAENLFDILNSRELLFDYYKRRDMYVLGVAADRESAMELLVYLIDDMMKQSGEFSPRTFFGRDKFVSRK